MGVTSLEHMLVMARDLDETRDFYIDVLGLELGPRPPFRFAGYWLYLGDRPVVHLAHADRDPALTDYFAGDDGGPVGGRGPIDHAAFTGEGLAEFVARLDHLGIEYSRTTVPETHQHQLFFRDPNGVRIEVNFSADEAA